jgi:hypothetical protein
VVVKNGKVIVIEIKSATSQADVYYFARKTAVRLGVEICTDPVDLQLS